MTSTEEITIEMEWLPPEILRGNSRAHWRTKAKAVRNARELGWFEGLRLVHDGIKMQGPIGMHIVAHNARAIDLDNILIGYKPVIDGFADSYLIDNDRNIKKMCIELINSKHSKSVITIYSLNS